MRTREEATSSGNETMLKPIPIVAVGLAALTPAIIAFQNAPVDALELKGMVENMGYTTKLLNEEKGKEKFEFSITRPDFNVPVGAEVAPSKNYVWFTVFLGTPPKSIDRHTELLRKNNAIQPSFFYITDKGNLMMAVPVDNRGITPAIVKRVTDKLADDVSKTASVWQEK